MCVEVLEKLHEKYSQYSSHTRRLLKYYVEKACDTALELLNMEESEIALSMLKTVEEDLAKCEAEPSILYYKYKIYYNIAHMCNE